MQVDVGDYQLVHDAIERSIKEFGGALVDTTPETFERVVRVNLHGVFHGCKAVGPHRIDRRAGKIINIASWFGKLGRTVFAAAG